MARLFLQISLLCIVVAGAVLANDIGVLELLQPRTSFDSIIANSTGSCLPLCQNLSSTYGGQVSFPNSTIYVREQQSYWSNLQASQTPACFFQPKTSEDLSQFVKMAVQTGCIFAVKCGGNGPYANYSSVSNGITVDMSSMGSKVLLDNNTKIEMGCCSTWGNIYKYLETNNMTTYGVRNSRIGNCGSVQGGAISFDSNKVGFGANNVLQFEAVLANGSIVTASASEHPMLYRSLKGTGTNMAIVTKITMPTVRQGFMWNGQLVFLGNASLQVAEFFVNFVENSIPNHLNASMWVTPAFLPPANGSAAIPIFTVQAFDLSGAPSEGVVPDVFQPLFALPNLIQNITTVGPVSNVTELVEALLPVGFFEYYTTWSSGLSATLLDQSAQLFFEGFQSIANEGNLASMTYQHISLPAIKAMRTRGGSPIGVERLTDPFQISFVGSAFSDPSSLNAIINISNNIKAESVFMAEGLGVALEYEYTNYASECQFPMRSYGSENYEFIVQAAKQFDPTGVFQNLIAGGPKLEPAAPPMCFQS